MKKEKAPANPKNPTPDDPRPALSDDELAKVAGGAGNVQATGKVAVKDIQITKNTDKASP